MVVNKNLDWLQVSEIDLLAGSLEYAVGSVGGFCAGKAYVIDHQRLSGLGYCFSASTPPMLTQAAIVALNILQDNPGTQHCHSESFSSGIFILKYQPC